MVHQLEYFCGCSKGTQNSGYIWSDADGGESQLDRKDDEGCQLTCRHNPLLVHQSAPPHYDRYHSLRKYREKHEQKANDDAQGKAFLLDAA